MQQMRSSHLLDGAAYRPHGEVMVTAAECDGDRPIDLHLKGLQLWEPRSRKIKATSVVLRVS